MLHAGIQDFQATCELVRADYKEMPGLCLTRPQLQRLCGLDSTTCKEVLGRLLTEGFLKQIRRDRYRRTV